MMASNSLWFDIVTRFSKQSRCKSRQVGAIVVKDDCMIAEGWNSPPKGSCVENCARPKCNGIGTSGSNLKEALCVHAEANAIANCSKRGVITDGAILYATNFPCVECCKLIISAGIKEVAYIHDYPNDIGRLLFYNANVSVRELERD